MPWIVQSTRPDSTTEIRRSPGREDAIEEASRLLDEGCDVCIHTGELTPVLDGNQIKPHATKSNPEHR